MKETRGAKKKKTDLELDVRQNFGMEKEKEIQYRFLEIYLSYGIVTCTCISGPVPSVAGICVCVSNTAPTCFWRFFFLKLLLCVPEVLIDNPLNPLPPPLLPKPHASRITHTSLWLCCRAASAPMSLTYLKKTNKLRARYDTTRHATQ